jgi:hypothetical protein
MAELLATGSNKADSADFTLTAGAPATLAIFGFTATNELPDVAMVEIQKKDSANNYARIGELTRYEPCKVLDAVGVFRVRRLGTPAGATYGVDQT